MPYSAFLKHLFYSAFILLTFSANAQTQEDFMTKLSEVYVNAATPEKAMKSAKELYKMTEQHKELQTYSNYLILAQLFENQTPDAAIEKTCKEKVDKLLSAMTGGQLGGQPGNDPLAEWNNVYYPALFVTTDTENASKAYQFLSKNPSLQTFNNFIYTGYAFERNGDFKNAKACYEKAITLRGDENKEFHTYSYYTNFLSRSGEYLKAEEYIRRMEKLSESADDILKLSYKAESLTSKVIYYLSVGDYYSYVQSAIEQYDYFEKTLKGVQCDPYTMSKYTIIAHASEKMGDYKMAKEQWRKRDSAHYEWVKCHNATYPDHKQWPLSILPVYLSKTGSMNSLPKPVSFYLKETEEHYNSFSAYADLSINYRKAEQLGFLGSPAYHEIFTKILDQISSSKDFRESTMPFTSYAYFTMRDRNLEKSKVLYDQLFKLNTEWINDIIFTFGEKAFVTYYNSKLKDGYENYHSFVKLASEKNKEIFPLLSGQAYNNLLFTKSLSLKGTQKRKQAFLKANDPAIVKLYESWLEKKQELIRQYRRSEDPNPELKKSTDKEQLKKIQDEVNHLENELTLKAKDFKKYLKITPTDWKSIRDKLKDGEAAIEMIRFTWRDQVYYSDTVYYAAYIITKTSQYPEVVYLPDMADVLENKYYKIYQNNIKYKLKDKDSYNHYWQPIRERLKDSKKIYFSPDGIYHLINLSTLINPETGKYLLDEIDIQNITSSSDLTTEQSGINVKKAVLIGRPSYNLETEKSSMIAMNEGTTRSFVRNFRDNAISDLPGTEEEVLTIKKEMEKRGIDVTYYLKEHATEEKVYDLQSPDVLHIATHGYWSETKGNSTDGYRTFNAMVNSGLLLSGVINYYSAQEYPDTYDGIVTAYEAQNLDLDKTSLVILSACETSLGHMDAGEGVYGLQRAFRAAGAKSIMTSLWKVDDEATRDFMILYYQELMNTNDKFLSFRKAQQQLKEKYPDPYYWGAFVLSGI